MNLCIIGGAGYVGLITGLGFARLGHTVTCVDTDADRVRMLSSGISPIYEEGLEDVLRDCLASGNIAFTTLLNGDPGHPAQHPSPVGKLASSQVTATRQPGHAPMPEQRQTEWGVGDSSPADPGEAGGEPVLEPKAKDLGGPGGTKSLGVGPPAPRPVRDADIIFVAVGSPRRQDGSTNLAQLRDAIHGLAPHLGQDAVLVIKSTLPAGTVEIVRDILANASPHPFDKLRTGSSLPPQGEGISSSLPPEGGAYEGGFSPHIAVNPEFLGEGHGLRDFFNPSRIVIGTDSGHARRVLRRLYAPFLDGTGPDEFSPPVERGEIKRGVPLVETTPVNAQLIKYASNAFLAMRISFINEIASISEQVGGDVEAVAEGMGHDDRIGHAYLKPGLGFGGPCLEKDLTALIHFTGAQGYVPQLLKAVLDRNDAQVREIISRARELLGGSFIGKRVALLGLAFKPGTNDVRSSLSVRVAQALIDGGAEVTVHDPVALRSPESSIFNRYRGGRDFSLLTSHSEISEARPEEDVYSAVQNADLVAVLTAWPEYREIDWARLRAAMSRPVVLDAQNHLDRAALAAAGFHHARVGSAIEPRT